MKIAKLSYLGMVSGLAGLVAVASAAPVYAQSQNCYATHSAGFARVRSLENKATTQGAADLEVRALFGPRIDLCEEGAYRTFMESFKDFASSAMRASKVSRDKQLRLAISVIQQAPTRVPAKEAKAAASLFRQVRSDLNATADDVGFQNTPLLGQLLEALGRVGAPASTEPAVAPDTTVQVPVSSGTGTTGSAGVQPIRVPTDPLPPWAVIKLYEMRDHIKAQDLAAIQIKLQDVINWIESKAPANQ